ncbi:MAG: MTH895/ArsE family thioredoxin-like protein, partial [Methyloversatilis sp.]|nr:MTH895/ArsE family thioredoxin-like protein [Methyloversatilis sp.]
RDQVIDIVRRVWLHILIGDGIGAAIHNWIPGSLINGLLGQDKRWSVPLAKMLGGGCRKCIELAGNTRKALDARGQQAVIVKVTDFAEIAAHRVMSTPAQVIDGKPVWAGKVLSEQDIAGMLGKAD